MAAYSWLNEVAFIYYVTTVTYIRHGNTIIGVTQWRM
jgi:hypothetical protein